MPLKIIVSGNLMSKLPKNWFLQKNISINDQRSADFRPFEIGNLTHKDVFQPLAKKQLLPKLQLLPIMWKFYRASKSKSLWNCAVQQFFDFSCFWMVTYVICTLYWRLYNLRVSKILATESWHWWYFHQFNDFLMQKTHI